MKTLTSIVAPLVLAAAVVLMGGAGAPASSHDEALWRHRNLGKALFETPTTVAQSAAELKKALDLAPGSYRDRLNYGLALLRSGSVKEGIVELEKAQKQDPATPHTWFNLGIAYKREGRYPDAIRQFERMIQLVPGEPVSHYNLGLLYNLSGREADGLKQFEIAAKLNPKLVAPRFQIYNVYRLLGKEEEAAKALAVFQEAKKAQKAADDSEDMEWSFYAELYDPIQAQPAPEAAGPAAEVRFEDRKLAGAADPKSAGLLAIDADGDGVPDLLAWSRSGIALYRSGKDLVENSGLGGIKGVLSVAAGDIDNDNLADLCITTESGAFLYRNVKGRFEKSPVALPAGRFERAVWLDFDHDYDLDLLLLGEKSALLRNEGQAAFRDATAKFPFVPGRAIDAVAFRLIPDTKSMDLLVSYAGRSAVLYRDQMRGVFEAVPVDAIPAGAASLRAADIDNDSWIDVAFSAPSGVAFAMNREGKFSVAPAGAPAAPALEFADLENRGLVDLVAAGSVYRNQAQGKTAPGKAPAGLVNATALAQADFDGDGRADLASVSSDGSVHLAANRTATKNQWLRVKLTGVKNLKIADGTEVEVKSATHYEKKVYAGVPLVFGLGPERQVDTVRISWPNGLIQNQMNEAASREVAYNEAPRLSGSCPMVFAWNGRKFEFIADVLGVAPLGASSGDGGYFPVDSDEYLPIPGEQFSLRDGRYEVRVTEELHEVTYLDQVRLIALDHPAAVDIVTNEKFKSPPFPEFRLFSVERRIYPLAARDGQGRDQLSTVLRRDRVYAAGFRHDMAGVAEMHSLELDFGKDAARDNRAVLILSGWIDWADGSTFLAASQRSQAGIVLPYLQVKDAAGQWRTVIEDMGVPAGEPRTMAVDLSGKFLSASREVRIVTNTCTYWDRIFLSENTAPPQARMTAMDAEASALSLRGFSRAVLDPRHEQPEYYDYTQWQPAAMWNPVSGLYTRFGDVRELTRAADDKLVIMGSGDELRLRFNPVALPPLPDGWKRDFLVYFDGWSKDADANTAYGDTVELLPFHGMSRYPYPASEHFPDDAEHRAYRETYNTRRPLKFIEPLVAQRVPY
ncbi:MAG TPA: FG-GAP-like repeat-containing protein [Bryobacteraceae bacterium]|nr:FG-GAP-like repeat-containing protein [Bryobacteraceae bacterium]